jgi:agmatinase
MITTMSRFTAPWVLLSVLLRLPNAWAHGFVPLSQIPGDAIVNDWRTKYGEQVDQPFSGLVSFAHLPYYRCLSDDAITFDVAMLGMPFDTGVTYRPG